MPVIDSNGSRVGKAVEALVECATGEISYLVVASGRATGIGEFLRAVPREAIRFGCDSIALEMPRPAFDAIEPLEGGDWPVKVVLVAAGIFRDRDKSVRAQRAPLAGQVKDLDFAALDIDQATLAQLPDGSVDMDRG